MRGYLSVVGSDSREVPVESSIEVYRDADGSERIVAESDGTKRPLGVSDATVSRKKGDEPPITITPQSECIEIHNKGNTNGVVVRSQGERITVEKDFVETIERDAILSIGYNTDLRLRVEREAKVEKDLDIVHEGEGDVDVVMGDQTTVDKRTEVGDDNIINRSDVGSEEPADIGDNNIISRSSIGGSSGEGDRESTVNRASDAKYCIYCGADLSPDAAVCPECGEHTTASESELTEVPPDSPRSEDRTEEDSPNVSNTQSQIIERDRNAITKIRHVTEGTVSWQPSRWVDTDGRDPEADDRSSKQRAKALTLVPDEDAARKRETFQTPEAGQWRGGGSGFIVSSDGYVVTNAHVVKTDRNAEEELFGYLAEERTKNDPILDGLLTEAAASQEERNEIVEILAQKRLAYYSEQARIERCSERVDVLNGRVTSDDPRDECWSATVEATGTVKTEVDGEKTPGRDIAILKLDGENLPTVPLGRSSDVKTGDEVVVFGYPGIDPERHFETRNIVTEPTMTSGIVSAVRQLKSGVTAIQTDAAINSGNSGGPIYDSDGEVIAVATLKNAQADKDNIGFGLPIEVAREFLDELGVENIINESSR